MNSNIEQLRWPSYQEDNSGHQVLKSLIVTEINKSQTQADFFCGGIRNFLTNNIVFCGAGNAYEFECQPTGFYIDCLYPNDTRTPVTISFADVLDAIEAWQKLCHT